MYTLVHSNSIRSVVIGREAIALASALLIAELFYKFGSFTLEAVTFIATWYVIGRLASSASDGARGPRP